MSAGDKKYRRLRGGMFSHAWAIYPPTLDELFAVLDAAQLGDGVSSEHLAARIGVSQDAPKTTQVVGSVALIPLTGVLSAKPSFFQQFFGGTATQVFEQEFRAALADPKITAIGILADSPGGQAQGNEEVAQTIFNARGTKPTFTYVRGMLASAAYYIGSATDKIIASPSSMIGSIGCIGVFAEYSDQLKQEGIGVTVLSYGKHKADLNQYQPATKQGMESWQAFIDALGQQFAETVARNRGVSLTDVLAKYGQGQIYLAAEAHARGMIDGIAELDKVVGSASLARPAAMSTVTHSTPTSGATAALPAALPATTQEIRPVKVTQKLKAALYACDLVASMDASDEVCEAVSKAYIAARGVTLTGDTPEALQQAFTAAQAKAQPVAAALAVESPAPANVITPTQASTPPSMSFEAYESRRESIQASGKLLAISEDKINAAIKSGATHEQIISGWHKDKAKEETPVAKSITITEEGAARFVSDAASALHFRLQAGKSTKAKKPEGDAARLASAPMAYLAKQCLVMAGQRVDDLASKEDVIAQAMQTSPQKVTISAETAYNRPGDFPNLLSSLANKILDDALELAMPTYKSWTGRLAGDLPDFKPAPIVNKGQHDELAELLDDEAFQEFGLSEECLSYMQLARYGNKFGVTPTLLANDDLNQFQESLLGMGEAHENTINRLCLGLVTGNVTMLDTYALFDNTNHGNDVTSGAAPSDAQVDAMNLKLYAQRGIGGTGYVRTPLRVLLIPPALERATNQAFANQNILEALQKTTDSTVNVFRGKLNVVMEPELQNYSSVKWFGMSDPALRASVIHAYFRGWGEGGRRQRWFDPNTTTTWISIEGRFGAAVKNYRYIVRNAGA